MNTRLSTLDSGLWTSLARTLCGFLLLGLVLLCGCALAPTPVEQHFFSLQTNTVPVVTVAAVTNAMTHSIEWTQTTNNVVTYTYTANTNAAALTDTARRVGNLFGPFGELIGAGLAGLFGIWGALRSRKAAAYVNATGALAQTIEVFREVLKTTPQGQELNAKLTDQMMKHQLQVGVIREVAAVVSSQVNNATAKSLADALLRELPTPAQ